MYTLRSENAQPERRFTGLSLRQTDEVTTDAGGLPQVPVFEDISSPGTFVHVAGSEMVDID